MTTSVQTSILEIAYEEHGDPNGEPVILLHGFPYDPRCFDGVIPPLVDHGMRVIVPWLRGFGPTRFRNASTLRSGQQAALAQDLLDFVDALSIDRALLAGFDWGGRAACVVAALHPERVAALVSVNGYAIQNVPESSEPSSPDVERARWYQHFFQHEIGRRGLAERRDELLRFLWTTWSPTWTDASAAYDASRDSFQNPDFVDVVIHSYRQRFGNVAGDPAHDEMERQLTRTPPIAVPTTILLSDADGVFIHMQDPETAGEHFTGPVETRVLHGIGHNPAQEDPDAFVSAIFAARSSAAGSAGGAPTVSQA